MEMALANLRPGSPEPGHFFCLSNHHSFPLKCKAIFVNTFWEDSLGCEQGIIFFSSIWAWAAATVSSRVFFHLNRKS